MAGHVSPTVIFRDVAVYFSEKEWEHLEGWQKDLYTGVIREIHGILISLGFVILNPNNFLRIQPEDEPCRKSRQVGGGNGNGNVAGSDCSMVNPDILLTVQLGEKQRVPEAYTQNSGDSMALPSTSKFIDRFGEYTAVKHEAPVEDYANISDVEIVEETEKCFPSNTPMVRRVSVQEPPATPHGFHADGKPGIKYAAAQGHRASTSGISKTNMVAVPQKLIVKKPFNACVKKVPVKEFTSVEPVTLKIKAKDLPVNSENACLDGRNVINYAVDNDVIIERPRGPEKFNLRNIPPKNKVQYNMKNSGYGQRMVRWQVAHKEDLALKRFTPGSPKEPERTFNCTECGKRFLKITDLRLHQCIHKMKIKQFNGSVAQLRPQPKVEIGRRAPVEDTFLQGISIKNVPGAKSLSCVFEKNANPNSALLQSSKSFARERRFVCRFCDKRFQNNSNLIGHERIHTGEKPFECPECKKTFSQKANLTTHQRLHTGERPFVCINCGKGFAQKINLLTHEQTHAKKRKKMDGKHVLLN